jgi:hypothetical protein
MLVAVDGERLQDVVSLDVEVRRRHLHLTASNAGFDTRLPLSSGGQIEVLIGVDEENVGADGILRRAELTVGVQSVREREDRAGAPAPPRELTLEAARRRIAIRGQVAAVEIERVVSERTCQPQTRRW